MRLLAGRAWDFNPRSLYGERPGPVRCTWSPAPISIHAPCTGSDTLCRRKITSIRISIHAPCTGSDPAARLPLPLCCHFNPRSLYGERLLSLLIALPVFIFQSTLPVRGATSPYSVEKRIISISIHAPCTGSDPIATRRVSPYLYFNPRSLYGERLGTTGQKAEETPFQSTLPVRGATLADVRVNVHGGDFNPRSLYGERRGAIKIFNDAIEFQSTLPVRGATARTRFVLFTAHHFNPRSLYGERPGRRADLCPAKRDFNPRSLYGERRIDSALMVTTPVFQSTLPVRGATGSPCGRLCAAGHFNPRSLYGERRNGNNGGGFFGNISIHAPCTGSDVYCRHCRREQFLFQSTLPVRGATEIKMKLDEHVKISIHAPCTGSDAEPWRHAGGERRISIHAPCTGSDSGFQIRPPQSSHFNPRSLYGERPHPAP